MIIFVPCFKLITKMFFKLLNLYIFSCLLLPFVSLNPSYFSCYPQDVSTASGFSSGPNWSGTLGQSQSVASIPRLSPKAETKKRRAPPPPPAPAPKMEHATVESCQVMKQFNLCQIYVCCSLCLCFMTTLGLEL